MIGYLYIQQVFKAILDKSKTIQGRFFVCPNWGSEMNNPNIEDAIPIGGEKETKWPAVLLMPPQKEGYYEYSGEYKGSGTDLWDSYVIKMLFLSKNSEKHTIPELWHDMDRVSKNFCSVFEDVINPLGGNISFDDSFKPKSLPITNIGNDKLSGILLSFKLNIFGGCEIEDYEPNYLQNIKIPSFIDIHKIHSL